jgi:hypothetical protein
LHYPSLFVCFNHSNFTQSLGGKAFSLHSILSASAFGYQIAFHPSSPSSFAVAYSASAVLFSASAEQTQRETTRDRRKQWNAARMRGTLGDRMY